MKRVRYITRANLQVASSPENSKTYSGITGESAEVPDDVASLLVDGALAVLEIVHKPTAEAPRAPQTKRRK